MPAKKRRVTFDPEIIRPASPCSPPPLALASYPAVIAQKDIQGLNIEFLSKSILKNGPQGDDKPYDSLCNVLIDLPPPPTTELLTLDVLQQETVFKPSNRFAQLKEELGKQAPIFEIESSEDEESDDELEEFELPPTTIDETINEEDISPIDIIAKPRSFESSLLLEQNPEERVFFVKVDDFQPVIDESDNVEVEIIPNVKQEYLTPLQSTNFLESSDTPVPISSQEESAEDEINFTVTLETQIGNTKEEDGVGQFEKEAISEQLSDNLQTPTTESDVTEKPANNTTTQTENEEIQETAIESPLVSSPEEDQETVVARDTSKEITAISRNEEEEENQNDSDLSRPANTLIQKVPLSTEPCALTSENKLITIPPSDSQFISSSSTNTLFEDVSNEAKNSVKEELCEVQNAEQVVDNLGNSKLVQEEPNISTNTSISPPFHDITNRDNSNSQKSQSLEIENYNSDKSIEHKQRRKSGRKGHRKHSRSAAKEDQPVSDKPVSDIIALQDQRAAAAQAKFKRYLAKMSGKATTETQNLNCAGEVETLEPHMRDSIKESQILIWIYNMIDEPARVDFEFFLKDGCILCKLMNRIVPGSIPEDQITWEGARSKQKNIANFLREAEKYGVPKAKLFFPEDILHLRHIPRVTRCIYALAKLAQDDSSLGEDTPQLGDEPSFLKAAPTKVVVPGHRDTRDISAQLTAAKDDGKAKTSKHSLYK